MSRSYDRLMQENRRLHAELAEWQRHGVKVTEDCETCGSAGFTMPKYLGRHLDRVTCPDCGGTGKKPRDGVVTDGRPRWSRPMVCFPAEWLEAE